VRRARSMFDLVIIYISYYPCLAQKILLVELSVSSSEVIQVAFLSMDHVLVRLFFKHIPIKANFPRNSSTVSLYCDIEALEIGGIGPIYSATPA